MSAKLSKSTQTAMQIKEACEKYGWTYQVSGTVFEINKVLDGSIESFSKADSEYYHILGMLPSTSSGSIWGTDGSGVGALSAMNSKVFSMKKSGGSKRILNALAKLQ